MEYHQDRFEDYSLMIYYAQQLLAVFPANIVNATVYSHQGLTYGGLVFDDVIEDIDLTILRDELINYLIQKGFKNLIVKPLPIFYNFRKEKTLNLWEMAKNNTVIKQLIILAIDYNAAYKIHKTKIKRYKKIEKNGFIIKEGQIELEKFWDSILIKRLEEKHNSKPVHSLQEIKDLQNKFEHEINQYTIYLNDQLLAGITLFKKGLVVKSQYAMATLKGENLNALDMLFVHLIKKFKDEGMHFFSMGTVNDDSTLGFSEGMLKQKQELGCSTYLQDIIKIHLND
nr:FemAB family protein [uncultured Psychroserpens sp.]